MRRHGAAPPGAGCAHFWYNYAMSKRCRSGQAMVEYVVCVAAMVVVAGVLGLLVTAARKSASRSEAIVSADSP